jgi:hypothetical protein
MRNRQQLEEQRLDARVQARSAAMDGDWLSLVLLHHQQIESAFEAVKVATDAALGPASGGARAVLGCAARTRAYLDESLFRGRRCHVVRSGNGLEIALGVALAYVQREGGVVAHGLGIVRQQ